jgi:hypothetical protein
LTNLGVLRLWEQNQFSPILRDSQIEKQLAEAVLAHRSLNPIRFDLNHPTMGRMISDQQFFLYALSLYKSHTARFVHYHHNLIPFIRGYAMLLQSQHSPSSLSPEMIQPPPSSTGSTFPPQSDVSAVPAPPSLVLFALGLAYVSARSRLRRSPAAA